MPPKKGYTDVHLPLPDALTQKLAHLVNSTGRTRSQLVEDALDSMLAHMADETMLAGLHQRLDALAQSVTGMQAAMLQLTTRTDTRLATIETALESIQNVLAPPMDQPKMPSNGRAWLPRKRGV